MPGAGDARWFRLFSRLNSLHVLAVPASCEQALSFCGIVETRQSHPFAEASRTVDPITQMKELAREGWASFVPFEVFTGSVAPQLVRFAGPPSR